MKNLRLHKKQRLQKGMKRAFDIMVALTMVLMVSWIYFLVYIYHRFMLRAKSRLFFIQPRVGKDNKIFNCIKFQTMNNYGKNYETNDRIIKYELFLRKYRIDELPQFFNVLKGDMSIVGPRPLIQREIEEYSEKIYNTTDRHLMKPGMTGLSQITVSELNGKNEALVTRKINQDVWYCYNWSFMLDLLIFFKTPFFVISRKQINLSGLRLPQTQTTYTYTASAAAS